MFPFFTENLCLLSQQEMDEDNNNSISASAPTNFSSFLNNSNDVNSVFRTGFRNNMIQRNPIHGLGQDYYSNSFRCQEFPYEQRIQCPHSRIEHSFGISEKLDTNMSNSNIHILTDSKMDCLTDTSSVGSSINSSSNSTLKVSWHNLSYVVDGSSTGSVKNSTTSSPVVSNKIFGQTKCAPNTILNKLNGSFKSGELTAIMGPSGCGKTTLLECISGKRQQGVSGDILFSGCKDVKLSFISQHDHLLCHLTVRESLLFASKLKNHSMESSSSFCKKSKNSATGTSSLDSVSLDGKHEGIFTLDIVPGDKLSHQRKKEKESKKRRNKSKKRNPCLDHESIVQKLLDQFGLNVCSEVRVSNCSGGQLKRLSIAQELVSKPNLLILDEPTSGLDSASCFQAIELLQQLTLARSPEEEPLAVVATIHQPSARVFNMFRKVFFLSVTGRCIYEGSPSDLVPSLSSVGLLCPAFNNPADYMLEVASGEYGIEYIGKLADANDQKSSRKLERMLMPEAVVVSGNDSGQVSSTPSTMSTTSSAASSSSSVITSSASSSSSDIHSLHKRLRDRKHLPFFGHINLLFRRTVLSIIRDPMLTAIRLMSHVVVAIFIGLLYGGKIGSASGCPPSNGNLDNVHAIQRHVYDDIVASSENVANLFFAAMFVMYGAMLPTVLTFPTELNVFLKERSNGWYHSRTYYLAKTMADIPMQFVFPIIYGSIIYIMSSQIWSVWRFAMFLMILILTGLSAQSHGLLVSAFFVQDPNAAVYVGPMSSIPFLLFAGFFVRIKTMPSYLVGISYISYVRYAFEAMISIIYGFDRCSITPLEVPVDTTGNSGSALFKFLSILFSPDYDNNNDGDLMDEAVNATTAGTDSGFGTFSDSGSFSPSKGLIESIVKDFQSSNPFFGDVFSNNDKNVTSSYVMKQFDLTETSLYLNIIRLLICFLVFRIAAYLVLIWKADRKR